MNSDIFIDVTAPSLVEIEIRSDGKVIWIHVDGFTLLRACRIENLEIKDNREVEIS